MKIRTAEEILESKANTNYDEDGSRCYYDWEVYEAMEEYAAQFIDLAAEDLDTKYEGEYGINDIIERVKLIKKQIK